VELSKTRPPAKSILDRYLFSRLRRFAWKQRTRKVTIRGLPEGLQIDILEELAEKQFDAKLVDVSYVHLSSWKNTGAYRLNLRLSNGRTWSLIYKNAIYDHLQIPALADFPVMPGKPEFLVYSAADQGLRDYLPVVQHCRELIPGKHYVYILQDLDRDHVQLAQNHDNFIFAVRQSIVLHQAMQSWMIKVDSSKLLQFDRQYSRALRKYAKRNLELYAQRMGDEEVFKVLDLWPQISELHDRDEFYEPQAYGMIHGDFHANNIYVNQGAPRSIRLIDWEWSGIGKIHADIASLLKRASPELEKKAFDLYTELLPNFSAQTHLRYYEWCHLERGLQAAFLAMQQVESKIQVAWIPGFMRRSMKRLRIATQRLSLMEVEDH